MGVCMHFWTICAEEFFFRIFGLFRGRFRNLDSRFLFKKTETILKKHAAGYCVCVDFERPHVHGECTG